ncbi:hypothetical protein C2845_PM07G15430 [Panicum miliaceum]|uniref:Uncharacterized protein n=1 Tax=Panicum miliaceum TaxID=4540 RepID=A0A3L6SGG2_PANMI|nr:hypothetical protein C2845_PM07G15430 [Panicum miliaceum]
MGIVLKDYRATGHGAEMKVPLSATHVGDLISTLIPPPLKRVREMKDSKDKEDKESATAKRMDVKQGGSKGQEATRGRRSAAKRKR